MRDEVSIRVSDKPITVNIHNSTPNDNVEILDESKEYQVGDIVKNPDDGWLYRCCQAPNKFEVAMIGFDSTEVTRAYFGKTREGVSPS